MPKAANNKKKANATKTSVNIPEDQEFDDDENLPDSEHSISSHNDDDGMVSKGKKRNYEEEDTGSDFGSEMHKVLESFGADITKTLVAKRKRLEGLTASSWKNNSKKVEALWKSQQAERQKMNDEFQRQIMAVFQQWDSDLDKTKDQEEKIMNLFRQQQKLFQQSRIVQSQRLKTIHQLHDQYTKGLADLEKCHENQTTSVQTELKKEMSLLQKKILMDTQQREMANVRKSLQTMLF